MFNCINSNNHIIDIEKYCINSEINGFYETTFCPFCGKSLIIRAKNSNEKTHFCHKSKQSCSCKSYDELFKSIGTAKTSNDINEFKKSIIKYSYEIFLKLKSEYIISLDTTLFLTILQKVAKPKILKLRNLGCEHIPYIWLNELGKFNNKVYLYTNSSKVDLNNIKSNTNYLWNTSEKKDIIIIAEELKNKTISRHINQIDLSFLDSNIHFPCEFLTAITPKIFDIFTLNTDDCENILKELLSLSN